MNIPTPVVGFGTLSSGEVILIFLVCLLFFGAKRLPELARSLGKSLHEFKKAASEVEDSFRTAMNETDLKKPAAGGPPPASLPPPAPKAPEATTPEKTV
jgi:sec-independent protein translocase protein TatA